MNRKIAWEEMKTNYPDEWLLITDFEKNESGHIISGVVARHSRNKDEVFSLPALEKECAFKYTGESKFPGGLRSHEARHHL